MVGGGIKIVGLAVVIDLKKNVSEMLIEIKRRSIPYSIRFRHCDPDSRAPGRSGRSAGCTDSERSIGIHHGDMGILHEIDPIIKRQ